MKILFSNLGYATGISGSLYHHVTRAYRHLYQPPAQQRRVLAQFRQIMDIHTPDLCCLVEVDRGSLHSGFFNQIKALQCGRYETFDIADKYGETSAVSRLPFHDGKSNGFLANAPLAFSRLYFRNGTKRLIYRIEAINGVTVLFAHFSLKAAVRQNQFDEITELVDDIGGEVIVLGDFNTLNGLGELDSLLARDRLRLLNRRDEATFTFHQWRHTLDLCLYTPGLENRLALEIIPQPFSDHAGLLVSLDQAAAL
ncbi:endonuclease/exonuclease/phosphatase family protein [Asticcacaulis machinosus]|uniref:Endonuclease/exonuclease/phosphatase family protein n=1 Tax=Asticcacaulis machinosus TaxID=2984211 RepID=A0ABT5HKD3_9CAUL|nr:endonuclease/exonuclease/phosphatase family protein [Asticcacaulis machinosus]MDC7676711.1 endonuclease/exonuclease/phosphatase family protein [Asticcacaulis machinosus]